MLSNKISSGADYNYNDYIRTKIDPKYIKDVLICTKIVEICLKFEQTKKKYMYNLYYGW